MADIRSEFLAYLRELHGAFGPQSSLSMPGEYASILNEEDWGIGYGNPQDKNVQTFTSWIIRPDGSCRLATEATEDEIIHVSDVLGALVDMCRFQENRHAAMSRIKSAKIKILKRGTVRGTITAAAKKAASSGKKARR